MIHALLLLLLSLLLSLCNYVIPLIIIPRACSVIFGLDAVSCLYNGAKPRALLEHWGTGTILYII